jgi:2'-5' RNA ligase
VSLSSVAPETMRAFVGLPLPDELAGAITALISRRAHTYADEFVFVRAADLHVTMKFLGQIELAVVAELVDRIDAIASAHAPPELRATRAWAFPDPERARVVVLEFADPAGELGALAHDLEELAVEFGVERETRAFRPHVTLARPATRRIQPSAARLCHSLDPMPAPDRPPALVLYRSPPATSGGYVQHHASSWGR